MTPPSIWFCQARNPITATSVKLHCASPRCRSARCRVWRGCEKVVNNVPIDCAKWEILDHWRQYKRWSIQTYIKIWMSPPVRASNNVSNNVHTYAWLVCTDGCDSFLQWPKKQKKKHISGCYNVNNLHVLITNLKFILRNWIHIKLYTHNSTCTWGEVLQCHPRVPASAVAVTTSQGV